jgi:hypothetical protein
MTRSLEAKRRRNRKSRQKARERRTLVWHPPAPPYDPDLLEHLEAQRELLKDIPDGDDPPRDP